jgi:hypothetical protein
MNSRLFRQLREETEPVGKDESMHDDLILADTEASYGIVDRLALGEGSFVVRIKKGVVVTVFPDGGDRYLNGRR